MRWKSLLAVLLGLLVVGMATEMAYALKSPTNLTPQKYDSIDVINLDGKPVPILRKGNSIIIGRTSPIGRGEILESINRIMIQRVLNSKQDKIILLR